MDMTQIRYRRLGYLALNVTDIQRSCDFYETLVGLAPAGQADGYHFFRCSEKHHDIALVEGTSPGLKRAGWEMESPEAWAALRGHFEALGLAPKGISNTEAQALGLGEAFRITDPVMGASLEFYVSMDTAAEPFAPTHTRIERLGQVVLGAPDLQEAERFFVEDMNFRPSDRIENNVVHLRCFPNPLHHSLGIGRSERAKLHHVNFMVSDIDDIGRANVRMKQNKVPIVYGPGIHPQSESMFFYFLDPDGITLEYSFGMELFPETDAREPRLFPLAVESADRWGGWPEPGFAGIGEIETEDA